MFDVPFGPARDVGFSAGEQDDVTAARANLKPECCLWRGERTRVKGVPGFGGLAGASLEGLPSIGPMRCGPRRESDRSRFCHGSRMRVLKHRGRGVRFDVLVAR
jgi:hypothetical protein